MALIVEDGSIVANADSYISAADAIVMAAKYGQTLPAVEADTEVLLLKAMDYIEAKRSRYNGSKTVSTQSLQFPRQDLYIDGTLFDENTIPTEVIRAQVELAVQAQTDDLQPTERGDSIIRERVDTLEREYSRGSGKSAGKYFTKAEELLEVLYTNGGNFVSIRV